ncbi:gluconokinase [Acidobacteriota bacterium]
MGDNLHSIKNIKKMKSGLPLNEKDRAPWLIKSKFVVRKLCKTITNAVFTFPGLTENHRRIVLGDNSQVQIVHLVGSFELIEKRLSSRGNHFFPVQILKTQFDLLEPPKEALTVDVTPPPDEIVKIIRREFQV